MKEKIKERLEILEKDTFQALCNYHLLLGAKQELITLLNEEEKEKE